MSNLVSRNFPDRVRANYIRVHNTAMAAIRTASWAWVALFAWLLYSALQPSVPGGAESFVTRYKILFAPGMWINGAILVTVLLTAFYVRASLVTTLPAALLLIALLAATPETMALWGAFNPPVATIVCTGIIAMWFVARFAKGLFQPLHGGLLLVFTSAALAYFVYHGATLGTLNHERAFVSVAVHTAVVMMCGFWLMLSRILFHAHRLLEKRAKRVPATHRATSPTTPPTTSRGPTAVVQGENTISQLPRISTGQTARASACADLSSRRQRTVPEFNFARISGMDDVKQKLLAAARRIMSDDSNEGGILLYGPPGNGKTTFGKALAGELGVPLVPLNWGDVVSKWVGDASSRIMAIMNEAAETAPCILFIDECDSMLSARGEHQADESNKLVTTLLTRLAELGRQGVVVIAATNFRDALDQAAVREGRFDTKIELGNPDRLAREGIVKASSAAGETAIKWQPRLKDWFIEFSSGYSAARVEAVARRAETKAREQNHGVLTYPLLFDAMRDTIGCTPLAESVASLSDIEIEGAVAAFISDVQGPMTQAFEYWKHGGSLPRGALFHGPPGTGKTLLARALAKSTGWNLIEAGGSALAQSGKAVAAQIDKASNMKPCILFIDEAEPLLKRRDGMIPNEALTRLLEKTGSAASDMHGVMLLAATNLPDAIDPAVTRGERFERQVEFALPGAATIAKFVQKQLHNVSIDTEVDIDALARRFAGLSLSDVQAAIRQAKNNAAKRALQHSSESRLRMSDFQVSESHERQQVAAD